MKRLEYIVVGLGIAGVSFCEQLLRNGKSFVLFDGTQKGATFYSGGVFNPIVLKRFNAAWNAKSFFPTAVSFYRELTVKLEHEIFIETPIYRIFKSIEEQNNWTVASDKREMQQFLSSKFINNDNPRILTPFGYGKVKGSAQISVIEFLSLYKELLINNNSFIPESFQYELLKIEKDEVAYKDLIAKKIVFADGAAAIHNPFFPKNGLICNKGEYLIIDAPELKLNVLLKGALYVIPLGSSHYKVGATYSRDDSSLMTTGAAKVEIISKLKSMIDCPFEVIGHTAGVRPTTRDRRPLLGNYGKYGSIAFLNGLGSRGFLMAPLLAEILYKNLEKGMVIPKEMDINRLDPT